MFTIHARVGRTSDYNGALYESDGTTGVALAAGDVLRLKIGRGSSDPLLEVTSIAATPNGSVVTITDTSAPAEYTIRLAQDDTADLPPGTYDCELVLVDDSETAPADAAKFVEYGVLNVLPSLGGSVAIS